MGSAGSAAGEGAGEVKLLAFIPFIVVALVGCWGLSKRSGPSSPLAPARARERGAAAELTLRF